MAQPSDVVILEHARKRAQDRGIDEEDIRRAAAGPDVVWSARPNAKTGRHRAKHVRKIGTRRLCVVVEHRGTTLVAVTAYWL